MIEVRVSDADFDIGLETGRLTDSKAGGVATFIGVVRGDGELTSLTLEHYPAMSEDMLKQLAAQAAERWRLSAVTLIHRTGTMHPGDRIVYVGTASPHRAAALESCAYLIDRLKTDAPFWKRETFADGRSAWVEPRQLDTNAAARWDQPSGS